MAYYFDTIKKSYADVSLTPGIDTAEFLIATEGVIDLFDILGSTAFAVVKTDMEGNVKKIRTRLAETGPEKSGTLQDLVKNEAGEKKRTATEGLMWLLRGLDFTAKALRRSLSNANEELQASFTEAYNVTLKQHHNFVVKGLFGLAMKAVPYRKDFYAKLGPDQAKVQADLGAWLQALQSIVADMQVFFAQGNYTKGL